jgi:hypothetical protein
MTGTQPRMAELLHTKVVDVDGVEVGGVDDVRLVQDGPLLEGFGAALRVEGLVVGRGGLAVRLGFHRHGVTGPALVRKLFVSIERRARYVEWASVESWEDETIRLRVRADDIPRITDV